MTYQLDFDSIHQYDPGRPGIAIPVSLKLSTGMLTTEAYLDTGAATAFSEGHLAKGWDSTSNLAICKDFPRRAALLKDTVIRSYLKRPGWNSIRSSTSQKTEASIAISSVVTAGCNA